MAGTISMGARREVLSAVAERYWSAGRMEKGRILDALCRTTGWHRKHAVRALRRRVVEKTAESHAARERKRRYGVTIKDALMALWEASDRVCGKRLVAMIPTLLPALEQHGRLQLSPPKMAISCGEGVLPSASRRRPHQTPNGSGMMTRPRLARMRSTQVPAPNVLPDPVI